MRPVIPPALSPRRWLRTLIVMLLVAAACLALAWPSIRDAERCWSYLDGQRESYRYDVPGCTGSRD
jgi:hypothetical protein